ncbi:MAG TPA: hypothetical protein VFZ65_03645 [Planctomycetota bacterium]|nr:hypothetical protein [Planctomycetota bacterium]
MNARTLVLAAILLAGLALGLAWLFGEGATEPNAANSPHTPAAPPAEAAADVTIDVAAVPAASTAQPDTTTRTEVAVPTPPAANRDATLRGRCVDADGVPIAGCSVTLNGWGANSERTDAWLRDHATPPEWTNPPAQTTGDDGTFSFTFWPPPPFQFALRLGKEGRAARNGRWSKIDEGSTVEVGDVAMQPGVRLTGRVVDEVGKPMPGVLVNARAKEPGGGARFEMGRVGAETTNQARTKDDGTFELRYWLAPGRYSLYSLANYKQTDLGEVDLSADRPLEDVTLVLASKPAVPTIAGRVLDENGQPVRGAYIHCLESASSASMGFSRTTSGGSGAFTIERDEGAPAEVFVKAERDGYDSAKTASSVPWGTADVELRLQRGGSLTVHVTDEANQPVENYTVRVIPRNTGRFSSDDPRVRAHGPYVDGTTTIPGITVGQWTVMVEFPSATALLTRIEQIEITTRSGARIDLRAETAKTRTLRVIDASGEPVAGTKVQLCQPLAGAFDADTIVCAADRLWNIHGPETALLVFEGSTGSDGTVALSGPGTMALGLLVLGPGHVPKCEADVYLSRPEPLVVTVSQGARLTGTAGPPDALAELRRLAGLGAGEPFGAAHRPHMQLRQGSGRGATSLPRRGDAEATFGIGDDGSFDIAGLPPGSWLASVSYTRALGANTWTSAAQMVAQVTLTDGATTHLDVDLQSMLPGTLEATVTLNGAPQANAQVSLQSTHGLGPDGQVDQGWSNVTTDANGRFTFLGRPGTYAATLYRNVAGATGGRLFAAAIATVARATTTRQDFAFWSGTLEITLLDGVGKPVPDVPILVSYARSEFSSQLPKTAGDGTCKAELTADTATLKVLPKRLQSQDAQRKLWQEAVANGAQDPIGPHWIALGTTTIEGGQTRKLELRLPADWDR